MARQERLIRIASNASHHAGKYCEHSVGAVVAKGNKVISTGACTTKTHPRNPKIKANTKRCQVCAEVAAILNAIRIVSVERLEGYDVYVSRVKKDGSRGISRPCKYCMEFMYDFGIRRVFYTDDYGMIQEIEVRNG